MVLVDTDVLLIDFRYPRDRRFEANAAFLSRVRAENPGVTIYSLMELLGQVSFNTSSEKLARWDSWLQNEYGFSVVWPGAEEQAADNFFQEEIYDRPFAKMLGVTRGLTFNDALILGLAERTPGIETIVTWNARHFVAETNLKMMTPEEYVQNL